MSRWYALILITFVVGSFGVAQLASGLNTTGDEVSMDGSEVSEVVESREERAENTDLASVGFLTFGSRIVNDAGAEERIPARNWDVLDPSVTASGVLVYSLRHNLPLFHKNSKEERPLASLTKLMTAVTVMEEMDLSEEVPVSEEAVATLGLAGDLEAGERYVAEDLMRVMLLSSSNDAAAAFEDYFGGENGLARILNDKAANIGMSDTVFNDGSGLADSNVGTPRDVLKLLKYIAENHPAVLTLTQRNQFPARPIGADEIKVAPNINPLVNNNNFLGGKTGTSELAGENLAALFSINDHPVVVILLNSDDRVQDTDRILEWVEKAYRFN